MRILISGASGFLGSHMCDLVLARGGQVVGIDDFSTGHPRNVAHLAGNPNFQLVEANVSRPLPESLLAQGPFDTVMHMASPASPRDYHALPIETLEVGSRGTQNMLEAARQWNARFFLTSTSECYGDPLVHPQVETYWGNVNPVGPRSCYDESKRFAEAVTMAYHRKYGLRTSIARIFNTYGPRMKLDDGRVVPQFIDQALKGLPLSVYGDGSQTRSFCYVSDLVLGLFLLSQSDEPYPTNIGNPREMTILEFAESVRAAFGHENPIQFHPLPEDDPKRRRPDITKAKALLGWEPKVSLEDGLRETVAYFRGLPA